MDLKGVTAIAERLCASAGWEGPDYIDHGNSAAVYRVRHPLHGLAALKIYDPSFFEGDNALIEAKRVELQGGLKGHGCPHLIEVLELGELPDDGTWFLLMEFCPWPSLEKRLADVPDSKVHQLLKQLTEAVLFLENRGYVHRDIKPANIAVSGDYKSLKLLDLGVLRRVGPEEGSGTDGRKFIATAQYSPPEFLSREEHPGAAGFNAINIYQIGAVLHDLIMKAPLFGEEAATKNKFILYKAVTEKRPRIANTSVPVRLIALCASALAKDASARTQSVTLQDFLAEADSPDVLRRRLGRAAPSSAAALPSLAVWGPRLRAWVRTAARKERDTLGASTVSTAPLPGGLKWAVAFTEAHSPVFVEARPSATGFSVFVVSSTEPPVGTVVFEVGVNGSDLPEADIPDALAVQYLYALDLALAADKPELSEVEVAE